MSRVGRRPLRAWWLVIASAGALGCSPNAQDMFEARAAPVLEARCATPACHGVLPDEPWPDEPGLFFQVDRSGRLSDLGQAREAARTRILTTMEPRLSSLVRVPLPPAHGGGPHWGGPLFTGRDDPAVADLAAWIRSEPDGSGGEDLELTELEAQFGEEVLPVLVERCARAGCHGPNDIAFTAFPARLDPVTGEVSPLDVRATHRIARKHLDLWGADPARSRLVRKALGPLSGGMRHRGGEETFFPDAPLDRPLEAPGIEAILGWARAERRAMGVPGSREPTGLLYVAAPPASRAPFHIEPGPLGGDLFLASWPPDGSRGENLTAPLHPEGPVEVRDPALAHDGRRVAFAMRREGELSLAVYELDLRDRTARRVSPEGAAGSFTDPVYAPDGRIVAVWDGHGGVGTGEGDPVPPELVALDGTAVERLTFTPAPEVEPAFLSAGKTRGVLVFGTRRRGPSGPEAVLFRFPLCHDPAYHGEPEYHVQFGATLAPRAPLSARDLPDGRQVMVVLDSARADDDRGALAVLDRSLGPALPAGAEPSVGGYLDPVRWLDESLRYRDPAPLPDGRVLVAADDTARPGEDALRILTLNDGPDGASVASAEEILRQPGLALRSPVPVFPRPPEDDEHPALTDPGSDRGYFAIRDAAVLEALYGRAAPTGPRVLREDLAAVRVLAPAGGAAAGLAATEPAVTLAEIPLAADRSAWLEVPARTPLLLQWLDGRGLATGNQLDRWFYAEGEELVPNGTNPATYAHVCTGCHGALSGDPNDASVPAPDAISAASLTLSTHEGRNPRRPTDPVAVPDVGQPVDFAHEVGPLFESRCAGGGCHGGDAPAAGLPLDGRPGSDGWPEAYARLLADGYVDGEGRSARASPLMERLLGEEMDAPGSVTGQCPPSGMEPELVRLVARWIETGAFHSLEAVDAP